MATGNVVRNVGRNARATPDLKERVENEVAILRRHEVARIGLGGCRDTTSSITATVYVVGSPVDRKKMATLTAAKGAIEEL